MEANTDFIFIKAGGGRAFFMGNRYICDILEPYMLPYAGFVRSGFTLMHDNARLHIAASFNNAFER